LYERFSSRSCAIILQTRHICRGDAHLLFWLFEDIAVKITCPICKEATTWEENPYRPFCSERCKLTDLGKWATEEYRIKGEEKKKEEAGEEEPDG
jgi:endogenous inhibitor of DNA gyrase (YacG/DUF329 family)